MAESHRTMSSIQSRFTARSKSQASIARNSTPNKQHMYLDKEDLSAFLPSPLHYNVSKESLRVQTVVEPRSNIIKESASMSRTGTMAREHNSYSVDALLEDYNGLMHDVHLPPRPRSPLKSTRGPRARCSLKAMWPVD